MAPQGFSRLPGFRDFPPEDLALRAHIFGAWRRVAVRYGFQEYDGPPLESLDLYTEKSGDEIAGQLYNFVDKGDRAVALRPEMTPSLARILGERSRSLPKPIRWFTIPQLFRYERAQRGRLREHFQWNVDIVGEEGIGADVEVVAVAIDALRELGLGPDDFRVRVSDRRLLTAVLEALGVLPSAVPATFGLIDKIERMPAEAARQKLHDEAGLDEAACTRLLGLLGRTGVDALTREFTAHPTVIEALQPLGSYVETIEAMGLGGYVGMDLTIVRGLAYYTGIVFELFDRKGELRAICGGGRYDRLLEFVGGDPLPAVGFGMGDVVLGELLAERGLLPRYRRRVDYFVVSIGEEQRPLALALAHDLRERGRSVAYALRDQSVRKQFKAAETEGARRVLVLGPDEAAKGVVVMRDMSDGSERHVRPADLP